MNIRYRFKLAVLASIAYSQLGIADNASGTCLIPDDLPAQPSVDTWVKLESELKDQLDHCLHSTDYFALYGASLLYTGDTAKAIEMLERALLIDPENGAARIDYAEALFQSNQVIAALQVNQSLLNQSNLPVTLHNFLESRKASWSEKLSYWDNQLTYLYGHSSNLNNATSIEELNLISADQLIAASVSPSYRAQSGAFHYASFLSRYYQLSPEGTERLSFAINTRDSHLNRSDTDEFKFTYENESEQLNQRTHRSVGVEHVRLGDTNLYSALIGTVTIYPKVKPVSYIELEARYVDFTGQSLLDETSFMVRPGLVYSNNHWRLGAEVGFGLNNEIDNRPGGDRSQNEASLFYDLAIFGGRLTSKLSYVKTNDSEKYSSLFGEVKRDTRSLTTSLQYFYPVNKHWILHASYYYRDQDSNIALFDTKTESVDAGFTYRF